MVLGDLIRKIGKSSLGSGWSSGAGGHLLSVQIKLLGTDIKIIRGWLVVTGF